MGLASYGSGLPEHRDFKPPENHKRVTSLLTACRAQLRLDALADLRGNT